MKQSHSAFSICAVEILFDLAEWPGHPSCQGWAACEESSGDCHLTYLPQTAKPEQSPASALPMTDTFPSLLVLRLFSSLSPNLFLTVQWKSESRHIHKILLTFRWIAVASIWVAKKISIPPPLSFPCSVRAHIHISDLKRGWFAFSCRLPHQNISHQL